MTQGCTSVSGPCQPLPLLPLLLFSPPHMLQKCVHSPSPWLGLKPSPTLCLSQPTPSHPAGLGLRAICSEGPSLILCRHAPPPALLEDTLFSLFTPPVGLYLSIFVCLACCLPLPPRGYQLPVCALPTAQHATFCKELLSTCSWNKWVHL